MLVDYVSPEKLPAIIVWLDWQLYAHRISLVVCLFWATWFFLTDVPVASWTVGGYSVSIFIGIAAWVVWCAFKQGIAVG